MDDVIRPQQDGLRDCGIVRPRRRDLLIRVRRDLERPLSAPTIIESCLAIHSAAFTPMPGAAFTVAGVVLAPQLSPTRMDDHRVAGLEFHVLALEGLLQVLDSDLVGVGQHVHALQPGHVDQHAACDERADLLDAELGEPSPARDVVHLGAVEILSSIVW